MNLQACDLDAKPAPDAIRTVSKVRAAALRVCCALAMLAFGAACAFADGVPAERPFALPDTQVVDLPKASNGIDYQLYVHVPPACKSVAKKCPVVYMLDAEYSFPLAATIVTRTGDRRSAWVPKRPPKPEPTTTTRCWSVGAVVLPMPPVSPRRPARRNCEKLQLLCLAGKQRG